VASLNTCCAFTQGTFSSESCLHGPADGYLHRVFFLASFLGWPPSPPATLRSMGGEGGGGDVKVMED
jgi:hypothetical protein